MNTLFVQIFIYHDNDYKSMFTFEKKPNKKLYDSFFVITATIDKYPRGPKLIRFSFNSHNYITDIENQYNPFEKKTQSYHFLTWTTPTPNTSPLYLYKYNEYIYPTFNKNFITTIKINNQFKKNWSECINSPIYVLKKILPFELYNNHCIPTLLKSTLSFEKCYEKNKNKPQIFLPQMINQKSIFTILFYCFIILFILLFVCKLLKYVFFKKRIL